MSILQARRIVTGLWRSQVAVCALAVGCAVSCGSSAGSVSAPTPLASSTSAVSPQQHVEQVLDVMVREAANATQITPEVRAQVLGLVGAARSIPDASPAIIAALQALDDFESHYQFNGVLIGPSPEPACRSSLSEIPTLPATIAYVRLEGTGATPVTTYAESVQRQIRVADRPGLAGWIVDLREDRGGNMWPMIAGLGPIFGERIIGWIVYNNRDYEREYRNGAALSLDEPFAQVLSPYTLIQPDPKVAVLTAETTNSAGEAIAVFFKNRPNTRSFGVPTCGHHHLLQTFGLSGGGSLTLKVAHNADRLKRTYAGPLVPDEVAPGQGEAVARAVAWILEGR